MTWTLPNEPPLELEDIQAHSAIGFGAAWQAVGAFTSNDHRAAADTIATWAKLGRVTAAATILQRKGRPARTFMKDAPPRSRASGPWLSIAVSHRLLVGVGAPSVFGDGCFEATDGMAGVGGLNDPGPALNAPVGSDWIVGGPRRPVDVLVIAAGGSTNGALDVIRMFETDAAQWIGARHIEALRPLEGATEHFGFRDGISQPAIFGTFAGEPFEADRRPMEVDRPRTTSDNDLVWPGEIWFGYPRASQVGPTFRGTLRTLCDGPTADFAHNGSLLVYRRLTQDVAAFRAFTDGAAANLWPQRGVRLSGEHLRAMMIGRKRTGGPVALNADRRDTPNSFTFAGDAMQKECPFSAHIRKVNPRSGSDFETVPRILRRGAPFGPPFDADAEDPPGVRGLAFLGYQSSFDRQFLRITSDWVNSPSAPNTAGGHDPVIGQVPPGGSRTFDGPTASDPTWTVDVGTASWVAVTGGAFLFSPSINALRGLAGHE